MGHVENEAVGLVEDDTAFFQVQVKDIAAFFPVCRNEVGMPARRIDAAQIVRDVDADEAAVNIFKSEAAFIFFQDLGKGQIGLLLFQFGPGRYAAEMAVDADDVDIIDAQFPDLLGQDILQGFNRRLALQSDGNLFPQPRHRGKGRRIARGRFHSRSIA